ncbi:MAG: F0F1 ATP synthase subunit B [Chlamydiales bacterium]|nr:F0F1 ATP synthase subunit B [Chlamydiales bacterium]
MHLDFAQVITQIFAFLIVFYVLKRFGWTPLLAAMNERTENIRSQFADIQQQRDDVTRQKEEYALKLAQIDAEGRVQIQKVIKEGRKISQEIQDAAKTEALLIIKKSKEEAAREILVAKNNLKNDMVQIAIKAAEKILEETIDKQKHQQLISDFVEHVEFK